MTEHDNTNRGTLFANKRRETDSHPTHTGSLNVDGVEYWLNAWVNEARSSGEKYFAIRINKKQPRGDDKPSAKRKPVDTSGDDTIPF